MSTGVIGALRKDDFVCSTYRDHVHAISKGVPSREIMAELFGKKTGICRGQGGSMHMFSKEHGLVRSAAALHTHRDRGRVEAGKPERGLVCPELDAQVIQGARPGAP